MINDFIYEFEITLPDGEVCYQVNNSPKLTKEFVDFLEEIHIDIYQCIYKVFNTQTELSRSDLGFFISTPPLTKVNNH